MEVELQLGENISSTSSCGHVLLRREDLGFGCRVVALLGFRVYRVTGFGVEGSGSGCRIGG